MRYIAPNSTLVLYRNDGKIGINATNQQEYLFGYQGVLIVGTANTDVGAGNYIDQGVLSEPSGLMQKYPTDLLGATTISIEMAGQGSLTGLDNAGAPLTNLTDGYRGIFFEAPPVAIGVLLRLKIYFVLD